MLGPLFLPSLATDAVLAFLGVVAARVVRATPDVLAGPDVLATPDVAATNMLRLDTYHLLHFTFSQICWPSKGMWVDPFHMCVGLELAS